MNHAHFSCFPSAQVCDKSSRPTPTPHQRCCGRISPSLRHSNPRRYFLHTARSFSRPNNRRHSKFNFNTGRHTKSKGLLITTIYRNCHSVSHQKFRRRRSGRSDRFQGRVWSFQPRLVPGNFYHWPQSTIITKNRRNGHSAQTEVQFAGVDRETT